MWYNHRSFDFFVIKTKRNDFVVAALNFERVEIHRRFQDAWRAPVFSRPIVKPSRRKLCVSPYAPPSPKRPQGASYSPMKNSSAQKSSRREHHRPHRNHAPAFGHDSRNFFRIEAATFLSLAFASEEESGTSESVVMISVTTSIKVERFGVLSNFCRASCE